MRQLVNVVSLVCALLLPVCYSIAAESWENLDVLEKIVLDSSKEGEAKSLDARQEDVVTLNTTDLRGQRLAYTHRILDIQGAGHYILLEDGSIWQALVWFDDPSVQLARTWSVGDIVEFHTDGGYFVINGKTPFEIKNHNNGTKISAWMDLPPPLEAAHYIADIDSKGRYVMLEDGSRWHMSWWQSWSSFKWNVGDRLFISHDFKNNHYLLYNVDIGGWQHSWVKAALQLAKYSGS